MKLGIVTYTSLHCNFTNYGTVLQAWAMQQTLKKFAGVEPVLVDYCPQSMKDKDPLNPMKNMWDTNSEAKRLCEMSLPAIKDNFKKIYDFYHRKMAITAKGYDSSNFDEVKTEGIERFLIGSDSIFDIEEFGLDEVYFANTPLMKRHSISYAPSFQDSIGNYKKKDLVTLNLYLQNFNKFSLREKQIVEYVRENVRQDVLQVLDPTLLLDVNEYYSITEKRQTERKYILYYSRRYNPIIEQFVANLANQTGLKVVEISLRANNAGKSIMRYDAGVEEFLSLIKHSEYVVTNSYHCLIFAIQFSRNFYVFSREHCDQKILELLQMLNLEDRYCKSNIVPNVKEIDYLKVRETIKAKKIISLQYLKDAIDTLKAI